MLNQSGGAKMDTLVKLVLIFFISLLSFSVGTFVGKGFSDSEHLEATLEKGDYKGFRDVASSGSHGEAAKNDDHDSLSEEEIASLTEEFVKSEKKDLENQTQAAHNNEERSPASSQHDNSETTDNETQGYKKFGKAEPSEEYKAKTEEKHNKVAEYKKHLAEKEKAKNTNTHGNNQPREVASAAQRVAEGKAPAADPKPVRKPDSVLPSVATSSVGKYTVQVAAYLTEEEAREHAAGLKSKGFSAFYVQAEVNQKTWYRVSVGLFTTQASAMDFRKELMREANITTAIVQKIVR